MFLKARDAALQKEKEERPDEVKEVLKKYKIPTLPTKINKSAPAHTLPPTPPTATDTKKKKSNANTSTNLAMRMYEIFLGNADQDENGDITLIPKDLEGSKFKKIVDSGDTSRTFQSSLTDYCTHLREADNNTWEKVKHNTFLHACYVRQSKKCSLVSIKIPGRHQ